MTGVSFKVAMLGTVILHVRLERDDPPAPAKDNAPEPPATSTSDIGPVTDHRAAPVLGFATSPAGIRRARERPVIK